MLSPMSANGDLTLSLIAVSTSSKNVIRLVSNFLVSTREVIPQDTFPPPEEGDLNHKLSTLC